MSSKNAQQKPASFKEVLAAASADAKYAFGEPEEVDEARGTFFFSTRDGGSVGDETPGKEDIGAARKVRKAIEERFGNVRGNIETIDEWTHLDFRVSPTILPPRPPALKTAKEMLKCLQPQLEAIAAQRGLKLSHDPMSRHGFQWRVRNGDKWDSPGFYISLSIEQAKADESWCGVLSLGEIKSAVSPRNELTEAGIVGSFDDALENSSNLSLCAVSVAAGDASGKIRPNDRWKEHHWSNNVFDGIHHLFGQAVEAEKHNGIVVLASWDGSRKPLTNDRLDELVRLGMFGGMDAHLRSSYPDVFKRADNMEPMQTVRLYIQDSTRSSRDQRYTATWDMPRNLAHSYKTHKNGEAAAEEAFHITNAPREFLSEEELAQVGAYEYKASLSVGDVVEVSSADASHIEEFLCAGNGWEARIVPPHRRVESAPPTLAEIKRDVASLMKAIPSKEWREHPLLSTKLKEFAVAKGQHEEPEQRNGI